MFGFDIITTDGTTLLGADDKAGISEIMDAMNYLIQHPDVKHGTIKICFTPDEEVGRGTEKFDVKNSAQNTLIQLTAEQEARLKPKHSAQTLS